MTRARLSSSADPAAASRCRREAWQDPASGDRYLHRWSHSRRARRDPLLVERALARHEIGAGDLVLDLPCGTGRLRSAVAARGAQYVGADISPSMASAARAAASGRILLAAAEQLPFADASFAAVICCRLLHHIPDPDLLGRTIAELVRVSSGLVVASFWDHASLEARLHRWRIRRPSSRVAHRKELIERLFRAAGAPVTSYTAAWPHLSKQVFAIAITYGARNKTSIDGSSLAPYA
jgi:ubiquinone/menaquinone biosynthesis C-methylase UbiE